MAGATMSSGEVGPIFPFFFSPEIIGQPSLQIAPFSASASSEFVLGDARKGIKRHRFDAGRHFCGAADEVL